MRRDADIGSNEGDTATPPDVPGCRREVGAAGERSEGLVTLTLRLWPDRFPDALRIRLRSCSGVSDALSEGASHMPGTVRGMGICYRPSTRTRDLAALGWP